MIELKNVSYKIDDQKIERNLDIIKDINLVFPKGKITVITGQNGSGKSTLIKLLMGIILPTEGKILYNNKDITTTPISQRANEGITLAFQQPVKFKGIKVRDMLNFANKENNNVSDACEYLARVGLCAKNYIDRELDDTLSGGELKRIEIAISLCKGGEVFLFDEPEAGIDLWSFEDLVKIFNVLKGKTIIIVSHQKRILEIADYILLLNKDDKPQFGQANLILPKLDQPKCEVLGGANG
ncbi:MAG: ABC transporter ATP-binding protein [Clostridia bacterium]|nr:ABC transporter ATP-binding protein [Clostridia bacterium]